MLHSMTVFNGYGALAAPPRMVRCLLSELGAPLKRMLFNSLVLWPTWYLQFCEVSQKNVRNPNHHFHLPPNPRNPKYSFSGKSICKITKKTLKILGYVKFALKELQK